MSPHGLLTERMGTTSDTFNDGAPFAQGSVEGPLGRTLPSSMRSRTRDTLHSRLLLTAL